MTRTVAALCVAGNSIYKTMPGVDAYDARRDARSYAGGMPIVAHPPCRGWSAYCAHQAKVPPGERELALWCVEQVRREGGVLEQPAHSRLWAAAGLPVPGSSANSPAAFGLEVFQADWGYPMRKATWLFCRGIDLDSLVIPARDRDSSAGIGDRRRQQVMSHNQRAATHPAFAQWLVEAARRSIV